MRVHSLCPEYRLRLFLSVDLAGSTAFKVGPGREPVRGSLWQPLWVQTTRDFYREFPKLVEQHYSAVLGSMDENGGLSGRHPLVWKTVGDEILFCCRVASLRHLSLCAEAFLRALRAHGLTLEQGGRHLDVKGAGWLAAFPAPNVTVALGEARLAADQFDENFELGADNDPRSVDFLGNGIDCGFRVAGRAASDRFALSVELAWLLAEAANKSLFNGNFTYHDRHILKGVLRDRPYPIVSIDTERSLSRQAVRNRERRLTGYTSFQPFELRDFLEHFMRDEGIEFPVLLGEGGSTSSELPPSYQHFRKAWLNDVAEISRREEAEAAAEQDENAGGEDLPSDLVREVDEALAKARDESEKNKVS